MRPPPSCFHQQGFGQRIAAVAAAALLCASTHTTAHASAWLPEAAQLNAALPTASLLAATPESAELKAALAKAKRLSDSKDLALKKGLPARLPVASAKPTDVSVALRSGVIKIDPRDVKATQLPQSIGITLPVVGSVRLELNVAVTKVSSEEAAEADVVVSLPSDLVKAGKLAAGGIAGAALDAPGLTSGRFELAVDTPRKGEADITLTSNLIPKLPVQKTKGLGRYCFECGNGAEPSDWFVARNLGNGVTFYGNSKTGVSQFDVPKGL